MSKIKLLDSAIANKIAAGEVIEKIGNVVKELVENSIDALATEIDINLIESGLKSITVLDNGTGMDAVDASLAFKRHATSKIFRTADLFRISSLGFRGEALPSIASISRVELITNDGDSSVKVIYEDGVLIENTSTSANKGTKITVTKLFYTTPARFKYLKSPQYELAIISAMINSFSLAYPNISFRLTNNQKLIFVSQGNENIINIIASIYSKEVAKKMIPFEGVSRDYKIHGFTSNPIINRSNKNYIKIFVNKRNINDLRVVRALKESYDQVIPKNRYPITILYIECDPSIIDVNVHPRKQEIKFSEYKKLLELIKQTITAKVSFQSIYQIPEQKDFQQGKMVFSNTQKSKEELHIQEEIALDYDSYLPDKEPDNTQKEIIPDMEYIGQYSGTYLLFQNEEGLSLLDQHAAAERIRYERYTKIMTEKNHYLQELLVPIKLNLSNDLLIKLTDYLTDLKNFGLLSTIENSTLIIKTIPAWFPLNYELIYAEEVVMELLEKKTLSQANIIDDLAKLLSCKHSLKANHYITKTEANHLVKDLRKCNRPYTCPHGRPIIVKISIQQIERLFNRVM